MRSRFYAFSVLAPLLFAPLLSGCSYVLSAPPLAPTPTPVPPVVDVVFDPNEGTKVAADGSAAAGVGGTPGTQLNAANDPTKPAAFRCVLVNAPNNLVLQGVYKSADGKDVLGTADTNNPVILTGIVVPTQGTPGYEEAMLAVQNWAIGRPNAGKAQDLDVYQDPVFPFDANGRRRVQVFFKGSLAGRTVVTGGSKGAVYPLSLNRMLVRAGWAVVDLYSPTSFDQKAWLFDETYARTHTLLYASQDAPTLNLKKGESFSDGKTINDTDLLPPGVTRRPAPLGIWKYGVLLQQRIPAPSTGTGALSLVSVQGAGGTGKTPGATPVAQGTPVAKSTPVDALRPSEVPGVNPGDLKTAPIQPPTGVSAPVAASTPAPN